MTQNGLFSGKVLTKKENKKYGGFDYTVHIGSGSDNPVIVNLFANKYDAEVGSDIPLIIYPWTYRNIFNADGTAMTITAYRITTANPPAKG